MLARVFFTLLLVRALVALAEEALRDVASRVQQHIYRAVLDAAFAL